MLKHSRNFSLEHLFSIFLIRFSYFNLIYISFITLVEHLCVGFEIVMSVGKTFEHRGDGRRTPLPQTPGQTVNFHDAPGSSLSATMLLQPSQGVAKTALYGLGASVFGHTCHTTIRTQLFHIQLSHTYFLSHDLSSTISTQLTHTFSHTTCSHTTFSHRTLSLDLSSTISFLFPAFPSRLHLSFAIGRS